MSIVLITVLVAAGIDLWKFRIHNLLTIPLILSGLVYHSIDEQASGLLASVGGLLVGALPFFIVYLKGGMGAGDIKLMAGIGAWLGPWAMIHVIIVTGLATGGYSLVLVVRNRLLRGVWLNPKRKRFKLPFCKRETEMTAMLGGTNRRRNAVPFGVMVALGVIVTALWIG